MVERMMALEYLRFQYRGMKLLHVALYTGGVMMGFGGRSVSRHSVAEKRVGRVERRVEGRIVAWDMFSSSNAGWLGLDFQNT